MPIGHTNLFFFKTGKSIFFELIGAFVSENSFHYHVITADLLTCSEQIDLNNVTLSICCPDGVIKRESMKSPYYKKCPERARFSTCRVNIEHVKNLSIFITFHN